MFELSNRRCLAVLLQVHANVVDESCRKDGILMSMIPSNIFVALIHRMAKEQAAETATDDTSAWHSFLDIVVPWKLHGEPVDDDDCLSLASPKIRFLSKQKGPAELVRLAERNLAEKFVTLVRGGADSKDSIVSLCLDVVAHFQPGPGVTWPIPAGGGNSAFATFRDSILAVANGVLALSCHGYPGQYDGVYVKKLSSDLKAAPQAVTGLVMAALSSSNFWQDRSRAVGIYVL